TEMERGSKVLVPRTHALSGREAPVSKCATWPRACTPRSVLPAQVTATGAPAIAARACARASCTVPPPGWVCQPRKPLPSYSRPRTILIGGLAELGEPLLGLALLPRRAVLP